MNNIELYIGDTQVEFDTIPAILYNYQVDDLTNPTVVKNSFSKTITIKGTRSNNHLFGHFWNVERVQVGGSTNASSVYFNASKKIGFNLFVNTELYEQGYVKLDAVRLIDGDYEYDITLFGGLGDFFYNLTTTEGGEKKKLKDLNFKENLDFTINIDTISEAWSALGAKKLGKWSMLNFMPAYNGLPDDFDANKILIDIEATNLLKTVKDGGKYYEDKDGWVVAELPEDMTEWEVRDLRSYLQRPCFRMKEIIKACCRPENNGGYEVELDPDFFNSNNPYWEDTWLTLPMLQTIEFSTGEQVLQNSKLLPDTATGDRNGYYYQPLNFDIGEYPSSVINRINVRTTINPDINYYGTYYKNTSWAWFWNKGGDSYHTGHWCFGSLFCQLLAFNGDTVVGASTVKNLTTPVRHNGKLYFGTNDDYKGGHKFTPYMSQPIYDYLGTFTKDGFVGEDETTPYVFNFTIDGLTTNVTSLKLCYYWGATEDKMKKSENAPTLYETTKDVGWFEFERYSHAMTDVSQQKIDIKSTTLKSVLGETVGRTGTEITKDMLLNTEASPCDYLLSYCKMFGMHFSKSLYENKIKIETRKTFYDRTKINDISDAIDYSKGLTINPLVFGSKWVEFSQEQEETQYVNDYKNSKGVSYGCKILNTGYDFNSDKKQLLEKSVIKSGIEGLERSKYFICYNNDNKVRPWFGYGMKYNLYNGEDTTEVIGKNSSKNSILGINEGEGLKYYDLFPKLQFHDAENKATDGNNVLVFHSGFKSLTKDRANPINYFLSDDSYYQTQLNDGNPCWLFVGGDKMVNDKKIAKKLSSLPVFERYLTDEDGTTIKKSLDFGTAQELFIPKYSITDTTNIYHNFWKNYLEDLYDVNTKILTAYVRLNNKVGYNLLKEFYWFENSIWRINKITDWRIGVDTPTKVEFIKVQDINDYSSITQERLRNVKFVASKYKVNPEGETITLSLTIDNNGSWRIISNNKNITLSKTSGTGDATITCKIPSTANPTAYSNYSITLVDDEGNTKTLNILQGFEGETQFKVIPSSLIVPSTGGSYDIDFEWVNQGDMEITTSNFMGDVTGNVNLSPFRATVNVNENTEDSVISGLITFKGDGFSGSVGIDQLPAELEFGKEGGEYQLTFNYNKTIIVNLPSWITVKGNTLIVLANYYEYEREATITVSNGDTVASMLIKQSIGGITPSAPKVTPTSLYFHKKGEAQLLTINITNDWVIRNPLDWVTLNMDNSDSNAVVIITADMNEGEERSGYINVYDAEMRMTYPVFLAQMGETSVPSITISPQNITIGSDGGIATISVVYENRDGDYLEVTADEGVNVKKGFWNGENLGVQVNVPKNETSDIKIYQVKFKCSLGEYFVTITQAALELLEVEPTTISFDGNGGTAVITISSNTDWTIELE